MMEAPEQLVQVEEAGRNRRQMAVSVEVQGRGLLHVGVEDLTEVYEVPRAPAGAHAIQQLLGL